MELKKFRLSFILLFSILAFGTTGYTLVEGMALFNAFYMTIITISTVGFAEIEPLSEAGRFITIIVITVGITTGGISFRHAVENVYRGRVKSDHGEEEGGKTHFTVKGPLHCLRIWKDRPTHMYRVKRSQHSFLW